MDYNFLGTTGLRVSRLALGTMPFGGDADEATSADIFARARDAGINFFDTADVYNDGRSEEVLGRLIKPVRDQIVLASKGFFPRGSGPNDRGASRYHLTRAVESSLRRLDTDRIDLYYIHRFDEKTDLEETLRCIDDLVSAGKVLYLGVSNFAAWQVQRAKDVATNNRWIAPVAVQPMYNLAKRQAEVELLPMAQANEIGVVSYSPLGGGLLSGKYGTTKRPDVGRLVDNAMYKVRYGNEGYYETAERFTSFAAERGVHPVSLAIAWVAAHPAITAPLIGTKSVEQLEPALKAAEIDLTEEERAEISSLSPAPAPATDRNEEATKHNYGTR
jgi:aryl-alcohol dehydrogenase-like predicted oxidoreductase